MAQRVGLPSHGRSRSFFVLAEPLSNLLTSIETGALNDPAAMPDLYQDLSGTLRATVQTVIPPWSMATGRNVKQGRVPSIGAWPGVQRRVPGAIDLTGAALARPMATAARLRRRTRLGPPRRGGPACPPGGTAPSSSQTSAGGLP